MALLAGVDHLVEQPLDVGTVKTCGAGQQVAAAGLHDDGLSAHVSSARSRSRCLLMSILVVARAGVSSLHRPGNANAARWPRVPHAPPAGRMTELLRPCEDAVVVDGTILAHRL